MKIKSNLVFEVRIKLGITQKVLAEMLGVAKNYVYLMESGKKPITDTIRTKLDELAKIEVHKREQTWTKNPDGTVRDLKTNESGNPNVPLPSQLNFHQSMRERLYEAQGATGLRVPQLADRMGVDAEEVERIMNEGGEPSGTFLSAFEDRLQPEIDRIKSTPCANCASKDSEIAFLRTQLAEALARIPKPRDS